MNSHNDQLQVKRLRCEYRKNPLGIDVLQPRLSWQLTAAGRNIRQKSYQIQVAADSKMTDLIWDSGQVESEQSLHVEYEGPSLSSRTRYYYRVKIWDNKGRVSSWSETAFWEMGILDNEDWKAQWITPDLDRDPDKYEPCPLLRREFKVEGEIESARIYATSLGLYQLQLNGSKVGDYYFTPGWTSYDYRLQYQTYDITGQLEQGNNALGAYVGDGWYKGDLVAEGGRNHFGDKVALFLQLHITYSDGSEKVITSDNSWRSAYGPIRMSEIYHGEIYDASKELSGWSQADYDDSAWSGVNIIDQTYDILAAQVNEPVKKMEEIEPIAILETPAGETVIDMGQNMVGWMRLQVKGKRGQKVTLKHAEVLDKDGNFYTENLREAEQTNEYILRGGGEEVFEPHFSFQGFRYVKIEDYPGEINLDNFKGIVLYSDLEQTGNFVCSHELINQLQQNIVWSQKGNFLELPTDCPQRDERLGWTGDAQVFIRTACFNMNVASFFTKWLKDLKAEQYEDGGVPAVIPDVLGKKASSSAAWGDAAAICPWTIYESYGDKRILEEQYESMKAWVEYIKAQGGDKYFWDSGMQLGDWLALDASEDSYAGATDTDYIATAFYAYSTGIVQQTAAVLGKKEDAAYYADLRQKILDRFREEFVTPAGRLAVTTQTAYVLALKFDLVEDKDRERIIDSLAADLKEQDIHLTTGFVGTPYLADVLSENGYNEIAYKLVQQKDYPSWLYPITRGATTIWEHWNGIKEDGSFWSADMNSFNHYAYGAIGDWLYRVVAGIDTDKEQPGYKHVIIKPQPGPGLTSARATYDSMYGRIRSAWKEKDGHMIMEVTIPDNTTSSIFLPGADTEEVSEHDRSLEQGISGINSSQQQDNGVKLQAGSGSYVFRYRINECK